MNRILKYVLISIGAVMMGFAVKCIYDPAGLVTGGFAGIAVLVNRITGIPLWVTNTVLNVPLFIITFFAIGKKMIFSSLFATVIYSATIGVLPELVLFPGDYFLSSVTGGLLMGTGIGMVLVTGATSGGVDLVSTLIHKYCPGVGVTWIMFAIDALIISAGALMFGLGIAVYAVISVFIVSFVSGKIIDGPNYSKAALIISDRQEIISEKIMHLIGRGVTGIDSRGMFSNKERLALYCVASRHEMIKIRELVYKEDPVAFMTICNVSEVLGEGFVKIEHSK